MVEVIPAVLPKTFDDLERALGVIHAATAVVQIDVVDGEFAQTKTWPYGSNAHAEEVFSGGEGLPFWENLDFEFDLMVENPEQEALRFIAVGASRIVVHAANNRAYSALESLQEVRNGDFQTQVGIALLPSASLEALEPFAGLYDYVQVMGIDTVGFQGQPFNAQALELLRTLRKQFPELPLQVDGGVTNERVSALVAAGATRLIVGSAVFNAPDPVAALEALYTQAQAA